MDILLSAFFAFFTCFFASTANSPLYGMSSYDYINLDSNYFYFEATQMLGGAKPYLNFYDHKGLYHLYIDCLGIIIGGRTGIWILEIVHAFISNLFLLKTVRLFEGSKFIHRAFAIVLVSGITSIIGSGNLEGEWMLPFVTIFIYHYTKAILGHDEDKSFLIGSFFMGLEVGLSINSRPLDAIWGVTGAIYMLVLCIKEKNFKRLLLNGGVALGACLIPCAIIWPIAASQGYFVQMMDAVFPHGMHYIIRNDYLLERGVHSIIIAVVMAVEVYLYFIQRKENKDLALYFLVTSLTAGVFYLIVAHSTNYYWAGLSFFALTLTYYLYCLSRAYDFTKWINKIAVMALITAEIIYTFVISLSYYGPGLYGFSYQKNVTIRDAIVNVIPEADRKKAGSVLAIDCDAVVYQYGSMNPNFIYPINQSWWAPDKPEIVQEVTNYLSSENKPTWVLMNNREETMKRYGEVVLANYNLVSIGQPLAEFSFYHVK
ncbi:MAG: hypothetical protein K5694_03495 [Bacilli bacterium]|nr:hypothetical protein [Bacilli bacterium]